MHQTAKIDLLEPRRLLAFAFFSTSSGRAVAHLSPGDDLLVITRLNDLYGTISLDLNDGHSESFIADSVSGLLIYGHEGNDVIRIETKYRIEVFAGDGDDSILGGSGSETLHGEAGRDTLDGGSGDDFLIEAERSDELDNENDQLFGRSGNDQLLLGGGDDLIDGGSGIDYADFRLHNDRLRLSLDGVTNDGTVGSAGGNVLNVERVRGGEGRDLIVGSGRNETLDGGGSDGADTIFGNGGDDFLQTVAPGSLMDGGSGDDTLSGRNATLFGQAGDDDLMARTSDDSGPPGEPDGGLIDGGSGRDELRALGAAFTLRGQSGDDYILYSAEGQASTGGASGDFEPLTAQVAGGAGADVLELALLVVDGQNQAGYDITFNDLADDGVRGLAGQMNFASDIETVRGSSGQDRLDASARPNGTNINGGFNDDTILGGAFADTLEGEDGADVLTSGAGEDILRGGAGRDTLTGGPGSDSFNGGKGDDLLIAADGAADTVNGAQSLGDSADVDELLDTVIRVESAT